ncbi:hypothetical protein THAOC_00791 [Thalassiosira oceanica]|uniref:Uncharacterized protein n=1 Tax=Thalassiosira oceanica TaxID=159749 RepID=K0TR90_THAOC|nr:hypothetical protein THAOC_00791 [Thalassiosira oceanica]|eukprot:EJK77382.1 hypothetical protein THAOC_00791 [Thalassiosira oceanica]
MRSDGNAILNYASPRKQSPRTLAAARSGPNPGGTTVVALLPASNNDCDIDANGNPEPATEAVQVDVRPGPQPLPVPVDAVGILGVAVAATLAHCLVARRSGWLGGGGVAAHAYHG